MARRRETNIFSLSLIDCICCGFGALILFHMIVVSRSAQLQAHNSEVLQAEVDKREQEVLEGQARLVEIRNSFRDIDQKRAEAAGLSTRILETLKQIEEELAIYEAKTVAQKEHVNKLKADLKSLDEGQKRLSGGTPSDEVPGGNVRNFVGDGDRQYLTGLKVGGKRILVLVDASASMLAEDIVNAVRRKLLPAETRVRARKWRQAVKAVDWLTAQLPRDSQYQLYAFNTKAWPVTPGTQGVWLPAKDGTAIDKAIATLRQTAPEGGTSLYHAFAAASAMNPPPDNIILLTDGLPTQGAAPTGRKTVSGRDRLRIFDAALDALPRGVPVNVVLFPMEGDPMAMTAFWKLAMASRGSMMTPSSSWP
jgi:von Willebrand factor type A domain